MTSELPTIHFSRAASGTVYGTLSPLNDVGILNLHLEELGFGPPHVVSGEEGLREFTKTDIMHFYAGRLVLWPQTTPCLTEPKRTFEQYGDQAVSDDGPGDDLLEFVPDPQQVG